MNVGFHSPPPAGISFIKHRPRKDAGDTGVSKPAAHTRSFLNDDVRVRLFYTGNRVDLGHDQVG